MTNNANYPVAMSATISEPEIKTTADIIRKYASANAETFRMIAATGREFVEHMESLGVMRVPNEILSEAAPFIVTDNVIQTILEPVMKVETMAAELEKQFYTAISTMLTFAEMQEARHA